jgi:hypothetical protein
MDRYSAGLLVVSVYSFRKDDLSGRINWLAYADFEFDRASIALGACLQK